MHAQTWIPTPVKKQCTPTFGQCTPGLTINEFKKGVGIDRCSAYKVRKQDGDYALASSTYKILPLFNYFNLVRTIK